MENIVEKKKFPPGLMALNRMTKDGKAIIAAQGHSKNSFKRNYETGTATYSCKDCGADLQVSINSIEGISGLVLSNKCVDKNPESIAEPQNS